MSDNLWVSLSEYFGNLGANISNWFTFINTSLRLPFELIGVVPDIIGLSISVVVFIAVTKLIIGR